MFALLSDLRVSLNTGDASRHFRRQIEAVRITSQTPWLLDSQMLIPDSFAFSSFRTLAHFTLP